MRFVVSGVSITRPTDMYNLVFVGAFSVSKCLTITPSTRYPATMHGAFATGLREAANIMTTLAEARGEQPRPRHTTANGGKVGAAAAESGRRLMRLASMLSQVRPCRLDIECIIMDPCSCQLSQHCCRRRYGVLSAM